MSFKKAAKYFAILVVSVLVATVASATCYRYFSQRSIDRGRAIHSPDGINTVERVSIGGIDQWPWLGDSSQRNA